MQCKKNGCNFAEHSSGDERRTKYRNLERVRVLIPVAIATVAGIFVFTSSLKLMRGDGNETPRLIFYQVGVHGKSQDLGLDASTAGVIPKSQSASERLALLTAEDEATTSSA